MAAFIDEDPIYLREWMEREERIKWYLQLHHAHYLQLIVGAKTQEERDENLVKLKKIQAAAAQLYGD